MFKSNVKVMPLLSPEVVLSIFWRIFCKNMNAPSSVYTTVAFSRLSFITVITGSRIQGRSGEPAALPL